MDPNEKRNIHDDKTLFYRNHGEFFVHTVIDRKDLKDNPEVAEKILSNPSDKIVFKNADGKFGAQDEIKKTTMFGPDKLVKFIKTNKFDLEEEFIIQHPDNNKLSPSAGNTIRIYTELDQNDDLKLFGCCLRISPDSSVDNIATGHHAAPIGDRIGIVNGSAVYFDITKSEVNIHSVSMSHNSKKLEWTIFSY